MLAGCERRGAAHSATENCAHQNGGEGDRRGTGGGQEGDVDFSAVANMAQVSGSTAAYHGCHRRCDAGGLSFLTGIEQRLCAPTSDCQLAHHGRARAGAAQDRLDNPCGIPPMICPSPGPASFKRSWSCTSASMTLAVTIEFFTVRNDDDSDPGVCWTLSFFSIRAARLRSTTTTGELWPWESLTSFERQGRAGSRSPSPQGRSRRRTTEAIGVPFGTRLGSLGSRRRNRLRSADGHGF